MATVCLECGQELGKIGGTHVQRCSGITMQQYYERHPEVLTARIEQKARWRNNNTAKQREAEERYRLANPDRVRANGRAQYARTPVERRQARARRRVARHYGLTHDEYMAMLVEQMGVCAICQRVSNGRKLSIDHDHETGMVRGLLCDNCNRGLGMFKDNPGLLKTAARYLELYKD